MKKKTLIILGSALVASLIVGGTFAAYAITDNANPFSVKITPGTIDTGDTKSVTLAWGAKGLINVEGLKLGEEKGPYEVGLLATTNDGTAFTGNLSVELTSTATGEMKLIDHLSVKVYEEEEKEHKILEVLGNTEGHKANKDIIVTSAQEKKVYFFIAIDEDVTPVQFEQMAEDVVDLKIDWNKGSNIEEVTSLTYYYKNIGHWQDVYAYAWNAASGKQNAAWPGVKMTLEKEDVYSIALEVEYDKVIFNDGREGGIALQTDDLDIDVNNRYFDGQKWGQLPGEGQEEPEQPAAQFEVGKPYVVGNKDLHTGVSAAAEEGLWGQDADKAFKAVVSEQALPEGLKAQYEAEITFAEDDEFKVVVGGEEALYWGAGYETDQGAFKKQQMIVVESEDESNGNIRVEEAGQYKLYIKEYLDGGWSVYVAEKAVQQDPQQPEEPAAQFEVGKPYVVGNRDYSTGTSADLNVELEGWAKDASKAYKALASEAELPENAKAQYEAKLNLEEKDEFKVVVGGEELFWDAEYETTAGAFAAKQAEINKDGNVEIAEDGEYTLFIKELKAGGWSVYLSEKAAQQQEPQDPQQPEEPEQPAQLVEFTIVNLPTWIADNDPELFAWAWGGDAGNGKWYKMTLNVTATNITAKFQAPANIVGFNMVRCAAGTEEPDWDAVGNVEGRVYNKTADIDVVANTFSYPAQEWADYPNH